MFGIEAARRAGMKIVAVATTNPIDLLGHVDLAVGSLKEIGVKIYDDWCCRVEFLRLRSAGPPIPSAAAEVGLAAIVPSRKRVFELFVVICLRILEGVFDALGGVLDSLPEAFDRTLRIQESLRDFRGLIIARSETNCFFISSVLRSPRCSRPAIWLSNFARSASIFACLVASGAALNSVSSFGANRRFLADCRIRPGTPRRRQEPQLRASDGRECVSAKDFWRCTREKFREHSKGG